MPFAKGNSFGKLSSRKGAKNKINIDIRQKFYYVYENLARHKKQSGDQFFLEWSRKNPNLYFQLFAKMAPKQAEMAVKSSEDFTKLLNSYDEETIINVEGRELNLKGIVRWSYYS